MQIEFSTIINWPGSPLHNKEVEVTGGESQEYQMVIDTVTIKETEKRIEDTIDPILLSDLKEVANEHIGNYRPQY